MVPVGARRHRLGTMVVVEAAVAAEVVMLEPAGSSWYVRVGGSRRATEPVVEVDGVEVAGSKGQVVQCLEATGGGSRRQWRQQWWQ